MAEIPVRPKRGAEIPVERKRRGGMWPWIVALAALVLVPLLFLRGDRRDDRAALTDSSFVVDTGTQFGGRSTATSAGALSTGADTGLRADTTMPRGSSTLRDTMALRDTTTRSDTAGRP